MQFQIKVLTVDITTKPTAKGSYQQAEVNYKDLSQNKVNSKKVMSFSNKEVFEAASLLKTDDVRTITAEKNEKTGYWDWVKVERANETNDVAPSSKAHASPRSTYETPEERA